MSSSDPAAPTQAPTNWYDAFPVPQSSPSKITVQEMHEELVQHLNANDGRKADFLVVDVRRTDFEDSFVRGAINLPAHSFYSTLEGLLPILSTYKSVIFHCQSSSGRGPRCAAWYQDALNAAKLSSKSKALVLEGGIKKWRAEYGGDEKVNVKL